ncbi:helix-turn-helix domain-containing protein [Acinetobacter pittii]|uniref:helix-turn-helix domain-containing protein n=1 Tax=Acinetobacter pittii TaxID=48296 RepID=UPI0021CDD912|nr:helix-turn-helix domain-containing protein [Acinetobacter pittii]MCU4709976.1 helix-turn-helix domain-containing protein [Acinetobacter pittii]
MSSSNTERLKVYLSKMTLEERKSFAKACLTTLGNLQQIIYVNKKCGAALAIRIDKESKGKVPCDELCPDVDFNYIRSQALTA